MKRISAYLTALLLSICLCAPALAVYDSVFVYDPDGILPETDAEALAFQASALTDTYDCGIYIFTVEDFTDYGYGEDDIITFAQDYYEENLLGCGEDRDGILLTLSTETRDASLSVAGSRAQAVFTGYAQDTLYDAFLDDFGNDDWYNGCAHYLSACEDLLQNAQTDAPADVPAVSPSSPSHYEPIAQPSHTAGGSFGSALMKALLICLLPAAIISFVICDIMKRKMNTARKASGAAAYISSAVDLKVKSDRYTHTTTVRTPIKTDSGSRGPRLGDHSHGGGSHSSHISSSSRKF